MKYIPMIRKKGEKQTAKPIQVKLPYDVDEVLRKEAKRSKTSMSSLIHKGLCLILPDKRN